MTKLGWNLVLIIGIIISIGGIISFVLFTNGSVSLEQSTLTKDVKNNAVNIPSIIIFQNGTNIQENNGSTNAILMSNSDASTVEQDAINRINQTKGGWIHTKGGTYNILTELQMPRNGGMTFTGEGVGVTTFLIPSGHDNNFMGFHGGKPTLAHNSYFNHFAHFHVQGNQGSSGINNSGFYINATGWGVADTTWDDVFVERFKQYDFYFNSVDTWNNLITNSIIEHASQAGIRINGTVGDSAVDFRLVNSKVIFNEGSGINSTGDLDSFIGNWFYKNNHYAIWLGSLYPGGVASASINVVSDNRFLDNGIGLTNTYDDIRVMGDGNDISGNVFAGGDNKVHEVNYNVYLDDFTSGNSVTGNVFRGENIGGGTVFFGTSSTNYAAFNVGLNPIGKVTNFINPTELMIGPGGSTSTITTGTKYQAWNCDQIINSTGGTDVNETIYDNHDNIVLKNQATLNSFNLPFNYQIMFTFTEAPTVQDYCK